MRDTIRKTVTQAFVDGWDSEIMKVVFANHGEPAGSITWGRFSIIFGRRASASVGSRFSRIPCVLNLQCFVKDETGTVTPQAAADKLDEIFSNRRFTIGTDPQQTHIYFEAGCDGPTFTGASQGNQQYNISLIFTADIST